MDKGLKDEGLDLDNLEEPGDRYSLGEVIGEGVHATVYRATDLQAGGKQVAIKIQNLNEKTLTDIEEEYKILRDLSDHPNLPDFYGVFKKTQLDGPIEIWFVMQLCGGGPVCDLVRALLRQNKRMDEVHIAFILKEVVKALNGLHENHVMHRDVKASNILLTEAGEVKLIDFGLSRELGSTLGKKQTCLGSPCWMAPEIVTSKGDKGVYDNRVDVWALGITAIELADGVAPFQDMHPTRALFQIVRNPPPTMYRPANWSQNYNDFIAECLTKNPEHRPYMVELLDHPFFSTIPDNDLHLNVELKTLVETITSNDKAGRKKEVLIHTGLMKEGQNDKPQPLFVEDVAALEVATEENILHHIESRYMKGMCYSFIGDVLLFLNPNRPLNCYGFKFNTKYKFKSRSDNEPHIYSVGDSAFQDMLHHGVAQNIVLSGETLSGKTTMFRHLLRHILFLAQSSNKTDERILKSVDLIHAFGNAATPIHNDSTRHILLSQLTFSRSGKTSGAIFWLYQLEKWRVTGNRNPHHANFHIFYYFYYGMAANGSLEKYLLDAKKDYCYLRREIDDKDVDSKCPSGPRENQEYAIEKFENICNYLSVLMFSDEEIETIWKTLAAILLLGEIEYKNDGDGNADIRNEDDVEKVATLLGVESKKLCWALCNYCFVEKDTAARRRHSKAEALEARNILAQTIYVRLVDWIVNTINLKFSFTRVVFGDINCITILDFFGFECYEENGIEQLFVNTVNEQLQYFYNQKIFIAEMQEIEEEGLQVKKFNFYDNRTTMDELLNKPAGIIHLLDEANRLNQDSNFVINSLNKKANGAHIKSSNGEEFTVAHYTGKVTYNVLSMVSKNRDFLPPEITDVMRFSTEKIIKQMFTNKLSRTGNVTLLVDKTSTDTSSASSKKRWGSALLADNKRNIRRYNTASRGEFSQTRGIRTAAAIFRAISLELLKVLSEGGTHFVRCVRTDLSGTPDGFQRNIVRQQLRALSVVDTAHAKLVGYSHRIPFHQFLESYQFLAFDFDENVEQTKDNCRLLLIRLKMEGWHLGNTKVFLKYYNEEYLSRLYETQVKKIIKVQSMLRSFLAKRSVQHKKDPIVQTSETVCKKPNNEEEAAIILQKHARGYLIRKNQTPLNDSNTGEMDEDVKEFVRPYFKKWKNKSMYKILMMHKAARHLDLVYFCQQVHLYNQNAVSSLRTCEKEFVDIKKLKTNLKVEKFIGEELPAIWKIPFNIKDLPICDSPELSESMDLRFIRTQDVPWDDPFKCLDKACQTLINDDNFENIKLKESHTSFIDIPFCRDPDKVDMYYGKHLNKQDLPELAEQELKTKQATLEVQVQKLESAVSKLLENQVLIVEDVVNKFEEIKEHQGQIVNAVELTRNQVICSPMKQQVIVRGKDERTPLTERKGVVQHLDDREGVIDYRKNLKRTTNQSIKPDPIIELEMKGKQVARSKSHNEDDPPFNFQAMLRKTSFQEPSMKDNKQYTELDNSFKKRSIKRTDSTKENEYLNKTITLNMVDMNNDKNIKNEMNIQEKKKTFSRKDSLDNIKLVLSATKDFKTQTTLIENGDINQHDDGGVVTTELVPGLIITGKIIDL